MTPVLRTDENWIKLYKQWVSEGKPGTIITLGGETYRVIQNTDEDIQFHPLGSGIDAAYSSRSTAGTIK